MKHRLLILILIICSMVICATSCNSFVSSSGVGQSGNETQNHEIDSINDQTLIFEQKTEDNTKVDSIPLVFDDYADFILYGTKGELDSSKYSNADILISNYRFNRESFVDIKSLLDLSNELPKGMSEEVVIEKNNEYAYYVYSRDELNRLKTEYRITVKYFDNRSNIAYNESIVRINNISDMLNRSGTFVYQNKDYDILYNKSGTSYKSISLINSNLSIGVFFEGDGATQSQIAEKCGDVVSKLVSDDTAVLNQTIDRMNDLLPNSSLHYGINSSAIENSYINNNPSLEDNNGQNGIDLPMDVRSLQSYIESRDREVSKRPQEYEITFEQAEKITTGMTFKEVVSIIGKGQLRPIPFSFNWHPAALYSWEICDEKGKTLFVSFDYTKEDFAELIQLSRDLFGDSEGSMDLNTYISTWESEEMTEFISDHLTVHGCSIRENDQSSQLTTEP